MISRRFSHRLRTLREAVVTPPGTVRLVAPRAIEVPLVFALIPGCIANRLLLAVAIRRRAYSLIACCAD